MHALDWFFKEVVNLVYRSEKLDSDLARARARVEHWNRIENNIAQNPAVEEVWQEFRVHYKLATGEDLPDFKEKKDVGDRL